jgi:histone H3/H4
MGTLNDLITIVAIHLKSNKPIQELIDKYGEEMIADAMQFVMYDKRETVEIEEDYDNL